MSDERKTAVITVDNVKTKQGAKGSFKVVGWKQPDGNWLNLTVFDAAHLPLFEQGNTVKVAYTEKAATDEFGEPSMYNGEPVIYRNVVAAKLESAAAPQTSGGKGGYDAETSKRQTAAHVAGAIIAAGTDVTTFDLTAACQNFKAMADIVIDWLNEKPLDAMLAEAKEKLGAEEVRDADDDIPFG